MPQDIPLDVVGSVVDYVKSRHPVYETPITLSPHHTIGDALALIHKRAHGAVVVVDEGGAPLGVFSERDAAGYDRFTQLHAAISRDVVTVADGIDAVTAFETLTEQRRSLAPVVDDEGRLIGVVTRNGALRSTIYRPAVDADGRLMLAVAVGINGRQPVPGPTSRPRRCARWASTCSSSTPPTAIRSARCARVEAVRGVAPDTPIVAGNVVTAHGTRQLVEAGADIVKVGVGPGAMCTTRVMTGVGRPQFSAVVECADEARALGAHVWADGGIRYPRDIALALAGGAANVMFGSWLAGTYESAADIQRDADGRLYKESFGMASHRAVKNRNRADDPARARPQGALRGGHQHGTHVPRPQSVPASRTSSTRSSPASARRARTPARRRSPSSPSGPSSGCRASPATARACRTARWGDR